MFITNGGNDPEFLVKMIGGSFDISDSSWDAEGGTTKLIAAF